ncbi:TIGR00645 family protein [Brevundimonas sp. AJA228-03]|uniref:TIGR00645 family protein n=1 Tax=Brevundimonas sp. AJA228-03 TaxID=2752515 RepID=UPI001AE07C99|nr:TIGR00645 family protein [Brevundimonas sp. AJA228-03]QTN20087.1 TIGR00645 family protein [Brevundimonas sp. AJA228-03]
MGLKPRIETAFERLLFQSRWLMAPFYVGLLLALAMLLAVFMTELFYYVPKAFVIGERMDSNDAILAVLTLVDLSLAGNLLLIVVFSGYENFVSKLDLDGETDRPPWMGKVDFSGLKLKLIASIVAISGIQLLKTFMNIGKPGYPLDETAMMWGVIIHLTFVASGVLLALMDWLTARTDRH